MYEAAADSPYRVRQKVSGISYLRAFYSSLKGE